MRCHWMGKGTEGTKSKHAWQLWPWLLIDSHQLPLAPHAAAEPMHAAVHVMQSSTAGGCSGAGMRILVWRGNFSAPLLNGGPLVGTQLLRPHAPCLQPGIRQPGMPA